MHMKDDFSKPGYLNLPIHVLSALSCVQPFVTPWTVACEAPLSMGFSGQKYRSGLPFPSPGDLPNPGIKPRSSELPDSLPSEPLGKPLHFSIYFSKMDKVNFIYKLF